MFPQHLGHTADTTLPHLPGASVSNSISGSMRLNFRFIAYKQDPSAAIICSSKLVNVVSGVPQGSVLGPLLFLLYTSELSFILENKLIDYADDSTLINFVPSPDVRVAVAESLSRDLSKVGE